MTDAGRQALNEYRRKWQRENRDKVREYQRKWQRKNPDRVRLYTERYWERKAAAAEDPTGSNTND